MGHQIGRSINLRPKILPTEVNYDSWNDTRQRRVLFFLLPLLTITAGNATAGGDGKRHKRQSADRRDQGEERAIGDAVGAVDRPTKGR